MIRDITIGQYYPVDSPIHKLDPRVKLISTIGFIVSLFLFKSITGYLTATVFLGGVIICSKVPVKFMLKGLKAIFFILLLTVCFNLFLTPGDILLELGFLKVTRQGIELAVFISVRLVYLILGSSIMTLTTTPNDLTDGLESIMGPLEKIRVPVHEISMMMSIALRFIPILLEETDKIMKAQMARGADFDSKNLIKKAKSLIPLLVPLFVSAFRRANDLSMAMEARCYRGGQGRTKMKPLIYKKRDYTAYGLVILYLVAGYFISKIKIL
jgi:energy-coupling factor transport system permease protein